MRCLIMTVLISLATTPMMASPSLVSLNATQQRELLNEAQQAYAQGLALMTIQPDQSKAAFATAAQRYTLLVESGIDNGYLRQNLGSAQTLSGNAANGIAHYLQAIQQLGHTPSLRRDLVYAKALRDHVEHPKETAGASPNWGVWLSDLNGSLTLPVRRDAMLIAWSVGWLGVLVLSLSWSGLMKSNSLVTALSKIIVVAGVAIVVLLTISISWDVSRMSSDAMAVVTSNDVVLREGRAETFAPTVGPIEPGAELIVEQTQGDWLAVRTGSGQSGWVERESVAIVPAYDWRHLF